MQRADDAAFRKHGVGSQLTCTPHAADQDDDGVGVPQSLTRRRRVLAFEQRHRQVGRDWRRHDPQREHADHNRKRATCRESLERPQPKKREQREDNEEREGLEGFGGKPIHGRLYVSPMKPPGRSELATQDRALASYPSREPTGRGRPSRGSGPCARTRRTTTPSGVGRPTRTARRRPDPAAGARRQTRLPADTSSD